jgi:hypothetical protein
MKRKDLSKMPIATNAPLSIENIHPTSEDLEAARKATLKHLQQGTITWYEIAKGELPPLSENEGVSAECLVYHEKFGVAKGKFWPNTTFYWRHNGGNWLPTHWAFINLPQTP